MAWRDTYRLQGSDLDVTRHSLPPQVPETRGKWNYAVIPSYFREEIINAVTIKAPTMDYYRKFHTKNWHNNIRQWPKAFRVLTDVGEGIFEVFSPWANLVDVSGQTTGSNQKVRYYDAYGNLIEDDTLIPKTFDLEQARFRSVFWYPGLIAYRVQFPQFDAVLVGEEAWRKHMEKVIQVEITQKSQAMNIQLWNTALEAYKPDYDPDFDPADPDFRRPMSWGSIPYYLNSIALKRTLSGTDVVLTPITEADIQTLDAALTAGDWAAVRDFLNSTAFWYMSANTAQTQTSSAMRQQVVATVNRGIADLPTSAPSDWGSSAAARRQYIARNYFKNSWWMVPSLLTVYFRGSSRVEQPQFISAVDRSSGTPVYPTYNFTQRRWQDPSGADFRLNIYDLERLYQAVFYNYNAAMPKLAMMHPDTKTYLNQLGVISRTLFQDKRKFGPADLAMDGEFRDLTIFTDLAIPKRVVYLVGADHLHVAFSDYEGMLNPKELPTQTMVDTLVAWTAYKWMCDDMRTHGIYWGFTTE